MREFVFFDVIYEDDQQKPDVGKQKTDKLVQQDKVPIIAGYIWSNVILASYKEAVDAGTFVFSSNAGPSQIAGEGCHQNFFNVSWQNDQTPMAMGETLNKRGIKRIVHISALGAAPKGSKYQRSKYAGERAVFEVAPTATILRPSIVFGPEDEFFNRFAAMAQTVAALPLGFIPLPGTKTKLQPVFVGDVAEAVTAAIARPDAQGRIYELGGPRTYTFRQLIDYIRAETDRNVPVLPLASYVAHPAGVLANAVFSLLPWAPPLTGDQVITLKRDNVVGSDPSALTIQDLGITQLESVEAIVPDYLWRFLQSRSHPRSSAVVSARP